MATFLSDLRPAASCIFAHNSLSSAALLPACGPCAEIASIASFGWRSATAIMRGVCAEIVIWAAVVLMKAVLAAMAFLIQTSHTCTASPLLPAMPPQTAQ